MEMDPQEREEEAIESEESPVSHNEEMSEGSLESPPTASNPEVPEELVNNVDEMRRQANLIADHSDILNKLKMQVRDIKVNNHLSSTHYQEEFDAARNHVNMASLALAVRNQESMHAAVAAAAAAAAHNGYPMLPQTSMVPFIPPPVLPPPATTQTSGGSPLSSEGSGSSAHNAWSFEEQFKQVRQLYEISDEPRRKEFLDDLFSFMQKRGTPINRLPIMAKSVLDLYELYNLVTSRGGLVEVINKKLWQEIIKGLHLPSSITSAAFTLRTQYMKYLFPYETDKLNLSTSIELQTAIDGNRREGRRTSYTYDGLQRSPSAQSQLQLVTQQQQLAACVNSVINGGIGLPNGLHSGSHSQGMVNGNGQLAIQNSMQATSEMELRMREYMRMLNRETQRQDRVSPPTGALPALTQSPFWTGLYHNTASQASVAELAEPQQEEALNLSESSQPGTSNGLSRRHDRFLNHHELVGNAKKVRSITNGEKNDDSDDTDGEPEAPSTQIKMCINTKEENHNTDGSISFVMNLNGVTYEGVLTVQSPPSVNARRSSTSSLTL